MHNLIYFVTTCFMRIFVTMLKKMFRIQYVIVHEVIFFL